jgi:hypothetical protein
VTLASNKFKAFASAVGWGTSHSKESTVRIFSASIVAALISAPAFAQTQPTRPSAYATAPTMPSAFATSPLNPCYPSGRGSRRGYFNPTSPCYSGSAYAAYSAVPPPESGAKPRLRLALGASSLNEGQAKQRVQAKGYSRVSRFVKDSRGIWRGAATLKNGRPVEVILDLQGNVYSIPVRNPHSTQ